jgi:hypothetical protein
MKIITVTVRDQRMREHDPILGVISLKLSEVLQTSSQVTRWYPLGGGIGYGRARISLLFRNIETRLPGNLLGWDVGTFEFLSDRIVALKYDKTAKLKLRTGGSSGSIPRTECQKLDQGDGVSFDIAKKDGEHNIRLPVKYRYRSPVVFEFHAGGQRGVDAYAVIWLQHLVDNEDTEINIPIWKVSASSETYGNSSLQVSNQSKQGPRLTQNYITELNCKEVPGLDDLEEVGRLQFRCRFKAGADESHAKFVSDNDARETQETWEACRGEGIRDAFVTSKLPERVQKLHDESLAQGRDVLKQLDPDEKKRWLAKDGIDWSGTFGEDPATLIDTQGPKRSEDRASSDSKDDEDDEDDEDDDEEETDSDLGIKEFSTSNGSEAMSENTPNSKKTNGGPISKYKEYKENEKALHRRHRGLMQWKPVRNAAFAKDEVKFGIKKMKNKMSLKGRDPDVETEV